MKFVRSKRSAADCYIFGKHTVDLAIERRLDTIKTVFISDRFTDERIMAKLRRANVTIRPLDDRRLPREVPAGANHQGIVAVVCVDTLVQSYQRYMKEATVSDDSLFLILSEVQDPQNVGAMIRSAAAFGVQAVLLPTHQQAPITGTVAKVSAGMVFTVPIVEIKNTNTTITDLQQRGVRVYGLAGEGQESIHEADFTTPTAIVVGNEGKGLREKTRSLCDALVRIPTHPRCESLNAAASVAVGLAIWSAKHQSIVQ